MTKKEESTVNTVGYSNGSGGIPQEVNRNNPTGTNGAQEEMSQMTDISKQSTESFYGRVSKTVWASVSYVMGGNASDIPEEEENHEKDTDQLNVEEPRKLVDRIDFLKDEKKEMTWSRRIALANAHKKWYNPHADAHVAAKSEGFEKVIETRPPKMTKKEIPSIETAWAYYEHFALPRYLIENEEEHDIHDLKKADPGENEHNSKLYDPLFTPLSQMGDFGLGVGLYFSTLRAITVMTLLAGLLNIPNFIFFVSDEYSDGQPNVPTLIKGSAVCTRTEFFPCVDCTEDQWSSAGSRFAPVTSEGNFTFALKNTCDGATLQQGMISYGTLLLVLIGIVVMNAYQRQKEIEFDEDEQTAQDYSIRIKNPPPDATDPEEWRKFFKSNFNGAHATVITVALDNDHLLRALRERRECIRKIELGLDPGTSLDILNLAKLGAEIERERRFLGKLLAMVSPGLPELFGRMAELEAKIKGWAQLEYPVSNVFVSFETEEDQRRVLSALNLGSRDIKNNATHKVEPRHLFRGELVLKVKEPDEPNTIRWSDLNVKFIDKIKPLGTTTLCSVIFIVLIAFIISLVNTTHPVYTAIAIAVFNAIFPEIAKFLTDFERHSSEGSVQTSLYFKIAVFRWVNTAIIITVITPFTSTLQNSDGLIPQIYAIFFAEILTTNLIQLADIPGHLKRHILAPRAVTQDAMNLSMEGSEVELAERYTNMTKILFLALWYYSVYPGALFMCSFALFINYFTDRFSLMRSWKRLPNLGTRISRFSRRYFFSTTIVMMAIVSAYFWSGFPYDNMCPVDEIDSSYFGTHQLIDIDGNLMTKDDKPLEITVTEDTEMYRFCFQDILRQEGRKFPPYPRLQPEGDEWMTSDQETITRVFSTTSLAVIALVLFTFLYQIYQGVRSMFVGQFQPVGDDMGIGYSEVKSISAYIPQVYSKVYSYPLLACSAHNLDEDVVDWTDPDRPHSYYDLTQDADELIGEISVEEKTVFSIVSYAPVKKRPPATNGGPVVA